MQNIHWRQVTSNCWYISVFFKSCWAVQIAVERIKSHLVVVLRPGGGSDFVTWDLWLLPVSCVQPHCHTNSLWWLQMCVLLQILDSFRRLQESRFRCWMNWPKMWKEKRRRQVQKVELGCFGVFIKILSEFCIFHCWKWLHIITFIFLSNKAIGAKFLLNSMRRQREAKTQQLQALIAEKKMELERWVVHAHTF